MTVLLSALNADVERTAALWETYISPSHIWGALIYLALLFVAGLVLSASLNAFVRLTLARDRFALIDRTAAMFLRQLGVASIWVILAVVYANIVPALRTLGTAMLAGVSVVGVVVGLAAQNTLGNLVSGVSLLIYRPFKVGDRLQVESPTGVEVGVVESLSLGYTILKTLDNRHIVMPNSLAATRVMVNLSTNDPKALVTVPVILDRHADISKARAILLEVAAGIPNVLSVEGCPVTHVQTGKVELSLRIWCREHAVTSSVKADTIEQMGRRFAAEEIDISIG